jgi:hypothetical protein
MNSVLWDVMPCSLSGIYLHFGGTYCLPLQVVCLVQLHNLLTDVLHCAN